MDNNSSESLIQQGIAFLHRLRSNNRSVNDLASRIEALEKSGFSSSEITEVLKRYRDQKGPGGMITSTEIGGDGRSPWLLNTLLPAAIVLGTGVIALYMTGGDDEPLLRDEDDDSRVVRMNSSIGSGTGCRIGAPTVHYDEYEGDDLDYPSSTTAVDDDRRIDSFAGRSSRLGYQQDADSAEQPPEWARELIRITNTISDDVQSIKELLKSNGLELVVAGAASGPGGVVDSASTGKDATLVANDGPSADAASAAAEAPNVAQVVYVSCECHLIRLRQALLHLATSSCSSNSSTTSSSSSSSGSSRAADRSGGDDHPVDADAGGLPSTSSPPSSTSASPPILTSTSPSPFQQGCGALLLYIGKVHEQPAVPRYRKIAVTNSAFRSLVEPMAGHAQVLAAVGFSRGDGGTDGAGSSSNSSSQGRNFEWTWGGAAPSLPSSSGVGGSAHTETPPSSEGGGEGAASSSTALVQGTLVSSAETDSRDAAAVAAAGAAAGAAAAAAAAATCSPYPRPASDEDRAAVLAESLRLLAVGKERGAEALKGELTVGLTVGLTVV